MRAPVRHLPPVRPATGEPPRDIGTGHPMREVTETVAADPRRWDRAMAERVRDLFDGIAPEWDHRDSMAELGPVLEDAIDRGGEPLGPVLELGAGTGAATRVLARRLGDVVAGDLSGEMLARLDPAHATRVRLDASRLPVRDASVGVVVCANMLLFPDEVRRVLAPGGALVWVNGLGERTPIHLPAEAVAEALGDGFDVTASRSGWATWAVARRV
jgi:SAM-dependent methyltransferase